MLTTIKETSKKQRTKKSSEDLIRLVLMKPEKKRILIVEDDPDMVDAFKSILYSINRYSEIDITSSADDAIHMISENEYSSDKSYDLVILDIFLRENKTGLDVWEYIHENHASTDVVVTSAISKRSFEASLSDSQTLPFFLKKPFSFSKAKVTLSEILF